VFDIGLSINLSFIFNFILITFQLQRDRGIPFAVLTPGGQSGNFWIHSSMSVRPLYVPVRHRTDVRLRYKHRNTRYYDACPCRRGVKSRRLRLNIAETPLSRDNKTERERERERDSNRLFPSESTISHTHLV